VILVSTYSYIDSSNSAIQCYFEAKGTNIPQAVINRYCWIMSTFTLPKHFEGELGDEFLHFGVGKSYFISFILFLFNTYNEENNNDNVISKNKNKNWKLEAVRTSQRLAWPKNRYCWTMSTFTLLKHFEGELGDELLHFGVGKI